MNITEIVQTTGWKAFMAKLYGFGASVVIIGALFKIMHWNGYQFFLPAGLITEAIIFFFSAFEPLHEELDWTLVYPELAGMTDPDDMESYRESLTAGRAGSVLERFDQIVSQSNISSEDFNKLGEGLQKMNTTASKISDITDASVATNQYVTNFKNAAQTLEGITTNYATSTQGLQQSVGQLTDSYTKTADIVLKSGQEIQDHVAKSGSQLSTSYEKLAHSVDTYFDSISSGNKAYGSQLENLNKNLSSLNAVYELQMKESNDHIKANQQLYSGFEAMLKNLHSSVEDTNKYKAEIVKLTDNLASLNTIYGNMLSAMNVVKK
jgi:gliding motility-associated protein GldL